MSFYYITKISVEKYVIEKNDNTIVPGRPIRDVSARRKKISFFLSFAHNIYLQETEEATNNSLYDIRVTCVCIIVVQPMQRLVDNYRGKPA